MYFVLSFVSSLRKVKGVCPLHMIECGVFNLDLDEHSKLSMKGSYFVLIGRFCGFSQALVNSVIMSVFLKPLINNGNRTEWSPIRSVIIQVIRELKQRRRRRLEKNDFVFYQRNSRLSRSVRCTNGSKNLLRLNMQ